MCGFIAGQSKSPWNPKKIFQGLENINHRGPDGAEFVIDNNIMLAHARLSIVGLNNGVQPIRNMGISIVVNGEFYNYEEIRKDLIDKGFQFQTESDSEILIYLYLLHGVNCLDYLHGEFAFVLHDHRNSTWFCARDRFGIRPLVWHKSDNGFLFASEAKALTPFIDLKLDKEALWFSQNFQYLPQDRTMFTNLNMVKPSHFILIKNGDVKEVNYWNPPINNTTDSISVATEKIEHLLNQAVAKRVPKEVKACTHLSGGIDSSSVTYLAAKHGIKDSFTISFTDDGFYNEVNEAKLTADKVGSNLHIVEVNLNKILTSIPKAIYHAEGMSINGHLSGKYLLNKAIREAGFKVAFSGEGSDEIFMGYSHLKQDYLSKDSLSQMEKSYLSGVQLPSGKTLTLDEIEQHYGFVPTWLKAKSSMAFKLSNLWTEDFSNKESPNIWFTENNQVPNYSNLKKSSFLWARYCLSGYILKVLDDAQSMAFSVEGRLPFLDTQLVDYVWSLPDSYYFNGNIEKHILRNIMNGKLPDEIVNKTKQSFMSPPLTRALQNKENKDFVLELLNNQYFINQHIFDSKKISKQLELWQQNPTPDSEPILMTLLSIASLCKEFKLND
jgi:asparagine synthase (glutamine-hydrolysing)